jgi:antitoxin component YwqK of YwqJK toxin-antitoxin module
MMPRKRSNLLFGWKKSIMSNGSTKTQLHIEYHKDGSIWARGQMQDEVPIGYWEWFRKDGTIMRSGSFLAGKQVGEWITYDREGKVHKVTKMRSGDI